MASLVVTPIEAHIHWDDAQQKWELKASRMTDDGTKVDEWKAIIQELTTFAAALAALLQWWNIVAGSTVRAEIGHLSDIGADMVAGKYDPIVDLPALYDDTGTLEDTTLTGTEYDGEDSGLYVGEGYFWGQTPPPLP